MLYLFNNCRNEDHLGLYGGNAFFDIWTVGQDAHIPNDLRPGDICWVASYEGTNKEGKRRVVLAKYIFTGIRSVPSSDAPGRMIWVLDGKLERREVLPKHEAAQHHPCSMLFNKLGHFKQLSVLPVAEQHVERDGSPMAVTAAAESPAGMVQIDDPMPHHGPDKTADKGVMHHGEQEERKRARAHGQACAVMWRDIVDKWCSVGAIFVVLLTVIAAFGASSTVGAVMALIIGGGVLFLFYRITRAGTNGKAPQTPHKHRRPPRGRHPLGSSNQSDWRVL